MASSMLERVTAVIVGHRYRWATETDLQRDLHQVLTDAGVQAVREYVLAAGERVDLWVPHGDIAIEVKVKGTVAALARQVARYVGTGKPAEILVVTTRATHRALPVRFPRDDGALIPVRVVQLGPVA